MGIMDSINGAETKVRKAVIFYDLGMYKMAIDEMDFSFVQLFSMSTELWCAAKYLCAKCYLELDKTDFAIACCNAIINHPEFNNSYISKAEALKKELLGE